jgi:hypothetical protein
MNALTQENNRLIAEFMGWDILSPTTIPFNLHLSNLEVDSGEIANLKYHSSWDWLMPIVSKCRKESNAEDSHWESVYYSLEGCDIDVTYQSVVDFIKWYNEQNY